MIIEKSDNLRNDSIEEKVLPNPQTMYPLFQDQEMPLLIFLLNSALLDPIKNPSRKIGLLVSVGNCDISNMLPRLIRDPGDHLEHLALAGVAAETGVVMLIYLDNALKELKERRQREGKPFTRADLHQAIMTGAVERVRPKMMTVAAIMAGLLPIMWTHGTGAEVMQRIAVPMIGGMVSSTVLTLVVIPVVYAVIKGFALRRPASRQAEVALDVKS